MSTYKFVYSNGLDKEPLDSWSEVKDIAKKLRLYNMKNKGDLDIFPYPKALSFQIDNDTIEIQELDGKGRFKLNKDFSNLKLQLETTIEDEVLAIFVGALLLSVTHYDTHEKGEDGNGRFKVYMVGDQSLLGKSMKLLKKISNDVFDDKEVLDAYTFKQFLNDTK